jgi:hypothetical protein
MRLLADFADRREQSHSLVAEAAIASCRPTPMSVRKRPPPSGSIGSTAIFNVLNATWVLPTKSLSPLSASGWPRHHRYPSRPTPRRGPSWRKLRRVSERFRQEARKGTKAATRDQRGTRGVAI